jgi:3-phytase/alkaline phosphatase D
VLAAALTAVALTLAAAVPGAGTKAKVPGLQFLGQAIVTTGTTLEGTVVGGLSGIVYDAQRDVFYSLSDDQTQARFYTLRVNVSDGQLNAGDVQFTDVTILEGADGQPFPTGSIDPEGIAYTKAGTLVITSEGFTNALVDPWVRVFSLEGAQLGTLPVPATFLPNATATRGVRHNLAFESAATAPNGRFLLTGTEGALVQDGPAASLTARSPARLLRFNLQSGRLDRQYVYWTDTVAESPVPPTAFSVNGLVDVLPLNNEFLLAMERSFSVGAPGTGNTIKLYSVKVAGATNVNGVESLAGSLDTIRPVEKTLLLDLDTLGIALDNVEGMTFGPKLPDGRQSLILVSDNNFAAMQFTQFLLFAVAKS